MFSWLHLRVTGNYESFNYGLSLYPVFTKFDMVDSQPVLTNLIEWIDDDVISDVTTDRFWI